MRILEIARRDNIKLGVACKKLIADLEARWQEVEPGWKFDPTNATRLEVSAVCFQI